MTTFDDAMESARWFWTHACLTGDCGHDHANECLSTIRAEAETISQSLERLPEMESRLSAGEAKLRELSDPRGELRRMTRDGALLLRHLVDELRAVTPADEDAREAFDARFGAWLKQADDYFALFPKLEARHEGDGDG